MYKEYIDIKSTEYHDGCARSRLTSRARSIRVSENRECEMKEYEGGWSTWERGVRVPGRGVGVPERGLEYLGEGL